MTAIYMEPVRAELTQAHFSTCLQTTLEVAVQIAQQVA